MGCITRRSDPWVLPGTLTTFRRRCGKATCRCASGDPHESPALVFTEAGRTKTVTLAEEEVAEVAAAVAAYQDAKAELDAAAAAGIARLRAVRAARRGGRR
ncbi:MAG TPA: DUF6788 family protein [Egibacteraceae bacterium]|nr:DUF6788 family protein [Egibacteraceae bacterium]